MFLTMCFLLLISRIHTFLADRVDLSKTVKSRRKFPDSGQNATMRFSQSSSGCFCLDVFFIENFTEL